MIKFLHCADLHLDSPLSTLDPRKAAIRRDEMRAAFTSLTLSAKMNQVDFLLIAGDLFDGDYAGKETVALLCREFEKIPDCRIIIAPGNHDPYTSQSFYRRITFPDNVYVFDSPEIGYFDFPEVNTTVWGYAFTEESPAVCPAFLRKPQDNGRIHLLVAHGTLDDPTSPYCPIPSGKFAGSGYDYAALGHVHSFDGIHQAGNTYYGYSGCLEGRGFDELGEKGAVIGAIEKEKGVTKVAAKFHRFSKRHYEIEKLDITGAGTTADAARALDRLIAEKHYGDDTALRVIFTGQVKGDFNLSKRFLGEQFSSFFLLEIEDRTLPLFDAARLKDDLTIRGEFYRQLLPLFESENEEEREAAALALRYGLTAMAGDEIADL